MEETFKYLFDNFIFIVCINGEADFAARENIFKGQTPECEMKKRSHKISIGKINIIFSNRVFYSLIAILVLAVVGVGVYASGTLAPSNTAPTTNPGHLASELTPLSPCDSTSGQFLKWTGTAWVCAGVTAAAETDPTVNNYVKNKASCADITGGAGLCDGVDNVGSFSWPGAIPVYRVSNAYCSQTDLTLSSTCSTRQDTSSPACSGGMKYYGCTGARCQFSSSSCANTDTGLRVS